jgi:hypothetical protein
MKEGHTPDEVAERVSYTARWVRTIVGPYSREGVQRISNHYLTLPRAKRLLTWDRQRELYAHYSMQAIVFLEALGERIRKPSRGVKGMDRIICDSAGSQRDCMLDFLYLVYSGLQQARCVFLSHATYLYMSMRFIKEPITTIRRMAGAIPRMVYACLHLKCASA